MPFTIAGAQKSHPIFIKNLLRETEENIYVRQIIILLLQFDTLISLAEPTTRGKNSKKPNIKSYCNYTAV
jgi:hypothetical protein